MKIKKAYTLLELTVVLSIFSIVFLIFSNGIKAYKNFQNAIVVEQCSSSIMTFINSCKQYCYNNEVEGYILCDQEKNRLSFYTGSSRKKVLKLPQGCKLQMVNTASGRQRLNFDSKGFTSDACTIRYLDLRSEHKITICRYSLCGN